MTTEPKYLVSAASRRNTWRVLLPLPGILAMLADTGQSDLVILDASVAIGLVAASYLPCSRLFSDLAITILHAAFACAHNYVVLRKQFLAMELAESTTTAFPSQPTTAPDASIQGSEAPWSCQVMSMFAMSLAGLHSLALVAFGIVVAATSLLFRFEWTPEKVVACFCILGASAFSEQRVAWLVCERQDPHFGYKALNSSATQYEDAWCSQRLSPRGVAVDHVESGAEDAVTPRGSPRGNHSDGLEESCYSGPQTLGSSRLSLADYVISRLSPSDASQQPSMADYLFSRLSDPSPAARAQRASPRHRFAAAQVQMPGAATHEAPSFSRQEQAGRDESSLQEESSGPLFGRGYEGGAPPNVAEPTQEPSGWWSSGKRSDYQALLPDASPPQRPAQARLIQRASPATNGSETPRRKLPDTEVQPHNDSRQPRFAEPPVSPPASIPEPERPVVLRGIKMAGFRLADLNVLFVESTDPDTKVNGRETYWSAANDYFLYRSEATSTWGAAKARRLQAVRDGTSNGVVHSPEGFEIWDSQAVIAHSKRGWREWDPEQSKWVMRAGSGVESRGKVRPKASPLEKASQAQPETCNRECQTDTLKGKGVLGSPIAEITPETS